MENIEPEYMEFCKYQQPIVQSWQHFSFSTAHISLLGSSTSLSNWLEENKAEKQDSKVSNCNAVALKNDFLVFYEMAKGFMSRYVKHDEYMHYWFKEEFCLRIKSSHCFMDWSVLRASHGHPSFSWEQRFQCHGTAVLLTDSELSFSCLSPASHVYEGQSRSALKLVHLSDGFRLLGSILPPF